MIGLVAHFVGELVLLPVRAEALQHLLLARALIVTLVVALTDDVELARLDLPLDGRRGERCPAAGVASDQLRRGAVTDGALETQDVVGAARAGKVARSERRGGARRAPTRAVRSDHEGQIPRGEPVGPVEDLALRGHRIGTAPAFRTSRQSPSSTGAMTSSASWTSVIAAQADIVRRGFSAPGRAAGSPRKSRSWPTRPVTLV